MWGGLRCTEREKKLLEGKRWHRRIMVVAVVVLEAVIILVVMVGNGVILRVPERWRCHIRSASVINTSKKWLES